MGAKVFCYQGINVQWPFAGQIMSGEKVEEVRKYPPGRWGLPMTGTPLFLVQTNGNRYPSVVLGIVTFSAWRQYRDVADFEASRPKTPGSFRFGLLLGRPKAAVCLDRRQDGGIPKPCAHSQLAEEEHAGVGEAGAADRRSPRRRGLRRPRVIASKKKEFRVQHIG